MTVEEVLRERKTKRRRALLTAAVTVLVTIVVILVVSALISPKEDSSSQLVTSQKQESLDLLRQAQLAEAYGETTKTVDLLKRSIALDSSNDAARKELQRIQATLDRPEGSVPPGGEDDSLGDQANDGSDAAFLIAVDDVGVLMPTEVSGWRMDPIFGEPWAVNATGDPTAATRDLAFRILVSVIDKESQEEADRFLERTSRAAYRLDGETVTVSGRDGYFGTDGAGVATVSFARGRYVFEVLMTSATGNPRELKELAVQAAEAFPTEMP